MAEYLPIHKPGEAITLQASATITGGQLVSVSGSGTVAPAVADDTDLVGVAAQDASANDYVTVYTGGVQQLTAAGGITAGVNVVAAAAGTVAAGSSETFGEVLGVALTTATDGNPVRVLVTR